MGMSKLAAARRKQQRTPVCERAAEMAAGPMCSTHSSKSALSRCCKKPCRWPMSVGLQELMPAGGRRGSVLVAHLAGGATRPPQRLRAAARPFPNAGFFVGGAITQPLFLARPAGTPSSAHRGRTRPLPPPGEPPNARAAPGGTASTAPRSLGATFENGSSQRHRGARWWLCRRTFRLMTCTDQNHPRNGVQHRFLSVGSSLQPRYLPP